MKNAITTTLPIIRRFILKAVLVTLSIQLAGCVNVLTTAVVEREKAKNPTFQDAERSLPPLAAGMGRLVLYSPKTSTAALLWNPNAGYSYRMEGDRNGRGLECGLVEHYDLSPGTHTIRRGPLMAGSPIAVTVPAGGTVYVNLQSFTVVGAAEAREAMKDLRLVEAKRGRWMR